MFPCLLCSVRYTVDDVKNGLYFPSTSICFSCYKERAKSKLLCFGKERKYDPDSIACGSNCGDERFCRLFIRHKL
jgi:hypothetical protein